MGEGKTRADHASVSDALYSHYSDGKDAVEMRAVVGEEGLSAEDRLAIAFVEAFESE